MNAAHTSGPWRFVRSSYANRLYVVGPANDGKRTTSDRICNLPNRPDAQGPANARLIAAAPELYEALREITATLDREAAGNALYACSVVDRIARAALAKVQA